MYLVHASLRFSVSKDIIWSLLVRRLLVVVNECELRQEQDEGKEEEEEEEEEELKGEQQGDQERGNKDKVVFLKQLTE